MKVSINKFLENPKVNVDKNNNFSDWFCNKKALKGRMLALVPKLKFLVKEGIIDGDFYSVSFKNNSPIKGSLYDDIRILRLDNGKEIGCFCPKSGHKVQNKCFVWTFDNEFITRSFKNWSEFRKKIKTDKTLRDELASHFAA